MQWTVIEFEILSFSKKGLFRVEKSALVLDEPEYVSFE